MGGPAESVAWQGWIPMETGETSDFYDSVPPMNAASDIFDPKHYAGSAWS